MSNTGNKTQIKVCQGTGCLSSNSDHLTSEIRSKLRSDEVEVEITGCHGFCSQGPLVVVDDLLYTGVTEKSVDFMVKSISEGNKPVRSLLYRDPKSKERIPRYVDIPYYRQQNRLLLEKCGVINPEKIEDYISEGGYEGLRKALTISPEEVINKLEKSGLRGRGGAGFPTYLKWQFTRNAMSPDGEKYIIINADEGDPGAFMDRSILEGDPLSVIEGATIGAYAIGASKGYIYVRAEYPLAVKRFRKALKQAREKNFLGDDILDSSFDFDIEVYEGAGAFVCGEETALIASIEGGRGHPVQKPPFPASNGLWGKPTNINNVKTWAAASWILRHGADQFREIGTEDSPGTAIFSLTGNIKNSGLIEVAMGTTLREIIYEIGGGITNDRAFKAVQTGGPSGGCIPEQYLDTPVDYKTLASLGSIMGSGGMVVIDQNTCIVDFSKYFLSFCQDESCGKCLPCREGTLRAVEILDRITSGQGEMDDLEKLEELSEVIKITSLCGLGQTAPNPVLSTLKYFREEYIEHIQHNTCRAGVCVGMFSLEINHDLCNDCSRCQRGCTFDAIKGSRDEGFLILTDVCEGCGVCLDTCPKNAIEVKPPVEVSK